jgi:hypothetical protein
MMKRCWNWRTDSLAKIWWDCNNAPYKTWKAVEMTTPGPVKKPVQYTNATCVEVVRGQGPNNFGVPTRVVVGAGDDAIYDPEMQEGLVLVDLTKDPDSTIVKTYMANTSKPITKERRPWAWQQKTWFTPLLILVLVVLLLPQPPRPRGKSASACLRNNGPYYNYDTV